jgi:hypothetical protein
LCDVNGGRGRGGYVIYEGSVEIHCWVDKWLQGSLGFDDGRFNTHRKRENLTLRNDGDSYKIPSLPREGSSHPLRRLRGAQMGPARISHSRSQAPSGADWC